MPSQHDIEQELRRGYDPECEPMTRAGARETIARSLGGSGLGHNVWLFPSNLKADICKSVLDTFDPGFTGEVFAFARLYIAETGQ